MFWGACAMTLRVSWSWSSHAKLVTSSFLELVNGVIPYYHSHHAGAFAFKSRAAGPAGKLSGRPVGRPWPLKRAGLAPRLVQSSQGSSPGSSRARSRARPRARPGLVPRLVQSLSQSSSRTRPRTRPELVQNSSQNLSRTCARFSTTRSVLT